MVSSPLSPLMATGALALSVPSITTPQEVRKLSQRWHNRISNRSQYLNLTKLAGRRLSAARRRFFGSERLGGSLRSRLSAMWRSTARFSGSLPVPLRAWSSFMVTSSRQGIRFSMS